MRTYIKNAHRIGNYICPKLEKIYFKKSFVGNIQDTI